MSTVGRGKVEECRGKVWPHLLKEAARLRLHRKEIEAQEQIVKDQIKTHMRQNGIRELYTITGIRAVLKVKPGRPKWDQRMLMKDLRVGKKGLAKYKKVGGDVYALTVYPPM